MYDYIFWFYVRCILGDDHLLQILMVLEKQPVRTVVDTQRGYMYVCISKYELPWQNKDFDDAPLVYIYM